MTGPIVFLDTETTSLRRDRRVWNIGVITRRRGVDVPEEIIIGHVDLADADPMALNVGGFWQRNPNVGGRPGEAQLVDDELRAALWLAERIRPVLTSDGPRPVHIVGAVPSFDVEACAAMMRRHQQCWPAHYHLVDVENVAVGALAARGRVVGPPYDSGELSRLLGVDPGDYARHTALGDAYWARDLFDVAMRPVTDR
ncbi:MAG: hypothetical protein ACRD0V_07190 [Acidimicrobiales bacterium]